MKKLYRLFFLILLAATGARAQETSGSLTGLVQDSSGHPLPGATITAVHQPSGTRYVTTGMRNGFYTLPNLRVGGPIISRSAMRGW
jgi:hypothetical protein